MSIRKKSLISTLKTTKKANVAKEDRVQGSSKNLQASRPFQKTLLQAGAKVAPGGKNILQGTRFKVR